MSTPPAVPAPVEPIGGAHAASSREARRFRVRMVAKTMSIMLLVGLVPLVAFGAIALKRERDRLRDDAADTLQSSASWISAEVDEWIDKNVRVLQAAASLGAIRSMQNASQLDVLVAIKQAYPWMYLVFTVGADRVGVARSDNKPPMDYTDRRYITDVLTGKDLSWETVISKTADKPALVLALPIKVNGTVVGALGVTMAIEDISRIVAWKAGQTGFAFLVDDKAKVVAHPTKELVVKQTYLTDHPLIAAFRSDGQPHLVSFTKPGGESALGYVRANKFHWAVAVQQDEQELFAPLRRTFALGLAILIGASAVVALIAWLSSKTLIRPLLVIARRNREMGSLLGLMDQGFVSMQPDGTLSAERSAMATQLLGGYQPTQRLWQAIAPHDPTFAAWLELGWASVIENEMPLELTLDQLPAKLVIAERDYRIEYKPAIVDGAVGDTLVVITDITAELARVRAEAAERDLLRMIERMARDRTGFAEFVEETDRLIHRLETTSGAEVSKELKRELHTLKGNCAIYGITQIAEWCHELEDGLAVAPILDANVVALVVRTWAELKTKLERVFGKLQNVGIDVEPEDITELRAAIGNGASLGIVEQIIENWSLERTRPRLERFAEQIRALATRLGKPDNAIAVDDHRVRLDPARFRGFWTAFSHVVRNAVDHGIELPSDRTAAGKPAHGQIGLATLRDGNAVTIELRDDGRGINWDALRARARDASLPHATRDDLVAAMLTDGITTKTAVTETSGRGVGLAALHEVCVGLGGTIEIDSETGQGTRFRFRFELTARERISSKVDVLAEPRPRSASVDPAAIRGRGHA